ncbi:MAG TPA: FtsL-like putative cell division protein [Flavisolibacter sp.]
MRPETPKDRELRFSWKRFLNYQAIVRQVPFFLFLAMMAVVYIYNGHYADKTIRDINKTSRQLKELQYEYKSVKGEALFRSKQSELIKAVEPLGLKELTSEPVVLTDSSQLK